jgi:hypothetical protein
VAADGRHPPAQAQVGAFGFEPAKARAVEPDGAMGTGLAGY